MNICFYRIHLILKYFGPFFFKGKFPIIDQNHIDGKKFYLNNSSWILLRLSGTEPVFRIYIESSSKIIMNEIKNEIFKYFKN